MTTLLVILLIIAGIVGYYFWKSGNAAGAKKQDDSKDSGRVRETTLEDVGPGGVIHLRNVGENMEEYDVNVLARHIYKEGNFQWIELEGDNGTQKVWLDVERDDELEISLALQKLKLRDVGLTKEQLDEMDEEEEGEFNYNGRTYYYEDSDKAVFYRDGDMGSGESFYYWDFETDDGKHYLSVEKWDSGSYEAHVSQPLNPSQIEIFSTSSNQEEN